MSDVARLEVMFKYGGRGALQALKPDPTWRFMGLSKYSYKYPDWGYKYI